MVNKQDSYWMECSLDEIVAQKVCEYLRGHYAEYRNAKQKIKELIERVPFLYMVVYDVFLRKYACKIGERNTEIEPSQGGESSNRPLCECSKLAV